MFPTGTAGAALFALRVSVAATLMVDGTAYWGLATSSWLHLGLAVPATFLCFGFLTPYFSAISCLIQLGMLLFASGQNEFHLMISAFNSGIVAVLGPGAYSVDARIFGRRLLSIPPHK